MKILVVCQYYDPEPFRISDICAQLVKRGHSVTVITGIPNYPMGTIYDGYRHGQKRDEFVQGVLVHRSFTVGRRQGPLWRFANYYSYCISSSWYILKIKETFDVVFVNQLSPIMMAKAGIRYKKKKQKKLLMYCLDLWPESLVAGNIKRDSLMYKFFHRVSRKIYQEADELLITSSLFSEYLTKHCGIPKEKIEYLPQYAEDLFNRTETETQQKEKDTLDLLFAGNIGSAQSVKTILMAAELLKVYPDIRFHILGDGSEVQNCRKLADCLQLSSVTFYGRKPIEDMPLYYRQADAMLVTMMDDPVLALTLPGKVQTYMAAGKPIIGAINGETRRVITEAKCGFCTAAEDAEALAESIKSFRSLTKEEKKRLCENSFTYYNTFFHRDRFMNALEKHLEELV